jgi:hypothetical protein
MNDGISTVDLMGKIEIVDVDFFSKDGYKGYADIKIDDNNYRLKFILNYNLSGIVEIINVKTNEFVNLKQNFNILDERYYDECFEDLLLDKIEKFFVAKKIEELKDIVIVNFREFDVNKSMDIFFMRCDVIVFGQMLKFKFFLDESSYEIFTLNGAGVNKKNEWFISHLETINREKQEIEVKINDFSCYPEKTVLQRYYKMSNILKQIIFKKFKLSKHFKMVTLYDTEIKNLFYKH